MDIKDLTWECHKAAERQRFVRTLMSGNINKDLYATYLHNQLQCYSCLEEYARKNRLFSSTPNLPRAKHIYYDYKALWSSAEIPPVITKSTKEYVKHLDTIMEDREKIYAHVYVRHLGDLSGGQMIMRKTPGPNRYYMAFKDGQVKQYKKIVRSTVNSYLKTSKENVVAEARLCFDYATRLFKEMYELELEIKARY